MTAAANDRPNIRSNNIELPVRYRRLVAKNGVTYYKFALIAEDGGEALKVTGTSGLKIVGWCATEKFEGDGTDTIAVESGLLMLELDGGNTPTAADYGATMYAVDDQTAGTSSVGGTLSPIGRLVRIERAANGRDMALCEVGMPAAVDPVALAAATAGGGASLVGIQDAGSYTAQTTVEGALAEIYAHLKGTQGMVALMPTDFTLLTGAPLALFADGASAVPGLAFVGGKAQVIEWNNNPTLDGIATSFAVPMDMDVTQNAIVVLYVSKTGADPGDAPTFLIGAFNQVTGQLYDVDDDFGGLTGAMNATEPAKTIQTVTRVLTEANLVAHPARVTLSVKPTDGTLTTDDLLFHWAAVLYQKKLQT